jgi:integrase
MLRRPRCALALPDWPAADRAAWQAATTPGDLFDDNGPASGWADSSRDAVRYDYGRWLMFVARHEPGALEEPLAVRVTPERISRHLAHLAATVGTVGRHSYLRHFADALRVMAPEQDWTWLRRCVRRLETQQRPRPKSPRIVDARRLMALGYALIDQGWAGLAADASDVKARLAYRDGLMIVLLAARPVRRRNFAAIAIGRQLIRIGEEWHLSFAAEDTKAGRAIETSLPGRLVPYLDHYLRQVRPGFPSANRTNGLWVGLKGGPLTDEAIYAAITRRTRQAFGTAVNPHLFRDCAATTIALRAPEQIGVARDLLGHSSLTTTERHYNQARSIDASRLLARVLARHRTTPSHPRQS